MSDPGKDICPIGMVEDAVKRPYLGGYIRKLAHRTPVAVKPVSAMEITLHVGTGVSGDPDRYIKHYYDMDGVFLAEHDSWKADQEDQEEQA